MAGLLDMLAQGYGGWPASAGGQQQPSSLHDLMRLVQTQQQ